MAGGFEYRPGQGVRPIGLFQRSRLLGPGGVSLQAGGANENPIGSANVFLDFVGFPAFRRRLSLQATYASDYAVRRQFGERQADERRTGGVGRAEIELTRGRGGRLAKLLIEGRRTSVELSGGANDRIDLTTIEVGGMFFVDLLERAYPYRLRWSPSSVSGRRVRASRAAACESPTISRCSGQSNSICRVALAGPARKPRSSSGCHLVARKAYGVSVRTM